MIDTILSILKNSLSITFFVLTMMLFIEFINVRTKGAFNKRIQKNGFQQILLGAVLGIIPGCFGAYTIVTLYTHNLISFGALTANLIAAMGDEAFLFYSIRPKQALIMTALLFIIGLTTGVIVDYFNKKKKKNKELEPQHFTIHKHEIEQIPTNKIFQIIKKNILTASRHRVLLLLGILIIFMLSIFGEIGHSHELLSSLSLQEQIHDNHNEHETNWLAISFVIFSIFAFFIISIISEHFLEEHIWNHVIKKHFIKIFGWTTIIIAGIHILNTYFQINDFILQHQYHILIIAVFVGLIPESGPHVIFLSLYVAGSIPMSILLANSIVQDGHGALPLFAESKKTFFKVKIINMFVSLLIGLIGLQLNL